jgi:Flp pilus assembly protein TadG
MRLKDKESGQVLVITAFCMIGLVGFLALAVDVGVLFHTRWQLQTAADAAATAAAVEYLHNGYDTSSARTAGTSAATDNNVSDGNTMTVAVSVNTNPVSPTNHQGCVATNCYFEAIVSKPNPTIFYRTFFALWKNSNGGAFTVSARAVAGTPGVSQGCGYLTAPTGSSLTVQGKWVIDASSCGLYINSSSGSVEDDTGKANKSGVKAQYVEVVGPLPNDVTIANGSNAVVSSVVPQTIPFSNVTAPVVPTTGCITTTTLTGNLSQGCYSGVNVTIGNATLGSGLYIFSGTGNVTINGAVSGTGVTLDINQGTLQIQPGNSAVNLSAPTSGTYNGLVIYQPLTNTNTLFMEAGSSTGSLTGFLYAPGATLTMQDNGGGLTVGGLVVSAINNGPADLIITGYTPSTSPLKAVALVE